MYKDSIFDRVSAFLACKYIYSRIFSRHFSGLFFLRLLAYFPRVGDLRSKVNFCLWAYRWSIIYHLILPTIVLGIGGIAGTMRIMRANFIDSMRAEFVTTARAKGLREGIIMFVHVFRNAIL